jgi:hypothetical protein
VNVPEPRCTTDVEPSTEVDPAADPVDPVDVAVPVGAGAAGGSGGTVSDVSTEATPLKPACTESALKLVITGGAASLWAASDTAQTSSARHRATADVVMVRARRNRGGVTCRVVMTPTLGDSGREWSQAWLASKRGSATRFGRTLPDAYSEHRPMTAGWRTWAPRPSRRFHTMWATSAGHQAQRHTFVCFFEPRAPAPGLFSCGPLGPPPAARRKGRRPHGQVRPDCRHCRDRGQVP